MSAAAILVLCAQALIAQLAHSQCLGSSNYGAGISAYGLEPGLALAPTWGSQSPCSIGNELAYGAGLSYGANAGYGFGSAINYGAIDVTPTNGGSLPVVSSSNIAPSGLAVTSENAIEGNLAIIGELPFLSAAALEGILASAGAGAINYGCGNGVTTITSNALNSAGAIGVGPAGIGYGAAGYGAAGYGAAGCGSGIAAVAPAAEIYSGVGGFESNCGCGSY
ncbi:chorion class B protein Ld10-like [Anticarsia gemmatalis]|uniref:chorion class B protein Ld10-like n=1 Tax=Anticarsia gemmatalis TaxID=129554 RepID=UPI003F770961